MHEQNKKAQTKQSNKNISKHTNEAKKKPNKI